MIFIRVGIYFSTHILIVYCISTSTLSTIISANQVQAVTSVGDGEFSSPVTVSLRDQPSDDSSSNSSTAVIIATVVVIVIILLCLVVAALLGYFCW